MPHDAHTAVADVKLGGAPLKVDLANMISRVVVERQRNTPAMAVVEFHDQDLEAMDDTTIAPGKELSITTGPTVADPGAADVEIFKGEIVAVEVRIDSGDMIRTSVRCYDKSHRMHRNRRSRTFLNQKDSDVVRQVVGDYGLSTDIEATTTQRPFRAQHDQTDWEFLSQCATENGFEFGVVDGTLRFHEQGKTPSGTAKVELTYGEHLLDLRVRLSAAEQPAQVTARGWDVARKELVLKNASTPSGEHQAGFPTKTWARDFTPAQDDAPSHVAWTPADATATASARRAQQFTTVFEADGECLGDPGLVPGCEVELKGLGDRISGTYVVSMVRHEFTAADGYRTAFTVNGCHDRSLLGLAQPGVLRRRNTAAGQSLTHPVVGIVSNIIDPDKQGRVKCKLPWLSDTLETDWAPVASVGGGKQSGMMVVPAVDDTVMLVFLHGDIRRPVVVGGLWNAKDTVPDADAVKGGQPIHQVWWSRSGHKLVFDDEGGKESFSLTTKDGSSLVMGDGTKSTITLSTNGDKCKVECADNGDVTITSKGKLMIDSIGDVAIKSKGKVDIEGMTGVKIKSNATMDVEGLTTNLKGTTTTTVKGAIVQIN